MHHVCTCMCARKFCHILAILVILLENSPYCCVHVYVCMCICAHKFCHILAILIILLENSPYCRVRVVLTPTLYCHLCSIENHVDFMKATGLTRLTTIICSSPFKLVIYRLDHCLRISHHNQQ